MDLAEYESRMSDFLDALMVGYVDQPLRWEGDDN